MAIKHQYDQNHLASEYVRESFVAAEKDPSRWCFVGYLEEMNRESRVLDLGCGFGFDLGVYHEMGFRSLFGVDASRDQCGLAQTYLEARAHIVRGSFEAIPLADQSIECVTSRYAFHNVQKPEKGIIEVARVLKDGGRFMFIVPHPHYDARHSEWHNADGTISVPLFGKAMTVTYPRHSFADYLGDGFTRHFSVECCRGVENFDTVETGEEAALLVVAMRKPRGVLRPFLG